MGFDVVDLLHEIEDIGRDPLRGGWSRHGFEPAELALREWFVAKAAALGLTVEVDRNTNLWATWAPAGVPDGSGPFGGSSPFGGLSLSKPGTLAIGSHLDSVPGGGEYDGPLGVASALDAVARLRAEGFVPARPVSIAVFFEEEGSRFGLACLGSKLMTGALAPARVLALADRDGTTFEAAARAAGLDPAAIGPDPERLAGLAAFVELHVEQGRGLVDLGAPVAVASGILAHGRWRLAFTGEGNHAGATAMADRHDPMTAFAEAVLAAERAAAGRDDPRHGRHARATIGRVVPVPGGTNVVASRVDAWLDVRGDDDAATRSLLGEIVDAARAGAAAHGCALEVVEESYGDLVAFDPALRDRLVAALAAGGEPVPVLATGAGHDAGVLGEAIPTAMLFVRNPTGVSHSPFETASDEDCRAGVVALATVIRELAGEPA